MRHLEASETAGVTRTFEISPEQNYSPVTTLYSQHSPPSMQPTQEQLERRRLGSTSYTSPIYIADAEMPVPDKIMKKAARIPKDEYKLFGKTLQFNEIP